MVCTIISIKRKIMYNVPTPTVTYGLQVTCTNERGLKLN